MCAGWLEAFTIGPLLFVLTLLWFWQMKPSPQRNWRLYARALDLHLSGHSLKEIGGELDVCPERARQIV
jgi:hypothetical protein